MYVISENGVVWEQKGKKKVGCKKQNEIKYLIDFLSLGEFYMYNKINAIKFDDG